MTVTTGYDVGAVTTTSMPLPSNGVIYVDNSLSGSCSGGFVRTQTYSGTGRGAPTSCGNAWIRGTYSSDLTIAADNDVILEDDVTRGSDGVLLGLIANNFVRVYHPVAFGNGPGGCNNTGDTGGRTIDAAILALKHSFINDNWYCGSPTGNLTVVGAISQRFRGRSARAPARRSSPAIARSTPTTTACDTASLPTSSIRCRPPGGSHARPSRCRRSSRRSSPQGPRPGKSTRHGTRRGYPAQPAAPQSPRPAARARRAAILNRCAKSTLGGIVRTWA